ncbi:PTS transporter subunit EIIC [Erysipelothrix urinaevulpis]|uniref:PTS transporter subunit EIIC n=1 Tax=Erysipelothrix urinaevulpis TaxID=2683717 RepID=UPI00135B8A02|nr:PTS transporter subunit EIIC [Erysipelothrix urinaevulpis]
MREKLQTYGKAMLVPIALVALGGLLLGLGGAFTNEMTVSALGINWSTYENGAIFTFFLILKGLGDVIFGNLSVLYAVGVAFSLAKNEKGWAAFSALVAWLAMQATIQTFLKQAGLSAATQTVQGLIDAGVDPIEASKQAALFTTELGFFTYRTGVFGGIAVGTIISIIHQKFYRTKLPMVLSFFSGTRTVPILSLLAGGALGIFFNFSWPLIGSLFGSFAQFVHDSGLAGTFIYRLVVESLIPFGLHPLLSLPMRWTELGGSMVVDGVLVTGNAAIQLAQLASPTPDKLLVRAFMGGSGIVNFAIFPGAAFAIYKTAKPENKKKVAGLLIPTILSTTLFGITEPILFTFLFVAPWLYFLVHVPLAALAEMLSEFFKVSIYQGNLKDWIPFFLRPEKLNMKPYLFLFPLFFIATYFIFKFLIEKFQVQTPGREEGLESEEDIKLYSKKDYEEQQKEIKELSKKDADQALAQGIIEALGGAENIVDVDNCISRLRVVVKDAEKVGPDYLWKNSLEAMGVIRLDNAVQIIYGAHVASVSADVRFELGL